MTQPRLRTDFWAAALMRRAAADGAYVTLGRRGHDEAGAVFVLVDRLDGTVDLYGPAPQSVFDEERPADRRFSALAVTVAETEARERMRREIGFDPDLWLVEIEDRAGRPFVDIVEGP